MVKKRPQERQLHTEQDGTILNTEIQSIYASN
jgi:hypothetical protein